MNADWRKRTRMKVQKHIITTEERDIDIAKITLLSVAEYKACNPRIPPIKDVWWLRSPGYYSSLVTFVFANGGGVNHRGDGVDYDKNAVRPVLRISNYESFDLSDKFDMAGYTWTVIADGLAICDRIVGRTAFRKDWKAEDANDYEKSDVKKWLENWAKEKGLR